MVARVKGLRNGGKERQRKNLEQAIAKKNKCKFWLMCMLDLKIFYIIFYNYVIMENLSFGKTIES